MTECRPPPGTPDGTVCWLSVTYAFPEGAKSVEKNWVWTGVGAAVAITYASERAAKRGASI